ncbi:MAG: DUF2269 family protein [Actinobacteria bacterium]|nr:DUF2269 family protein [Actinomycetota bacterium]
MSVLAAGINSGAYKLVLVLHIMCAIVGFGAVYLNGLYAAQVRAHKGREGLAISEANYAVSSVAEYLIYAVPILGIILVALSDKVWKFSQGWVSASFVLYIVGIAVSHAVMRPGHKRMNALMRELTSAGPPVSGAGGAPPQVLEMEAVGKRMAAGGLFLDVLLVVIVYLMVFKPGA